MLSSIGSGLLLLAIIFIVPWATVVGISFFARDHFKAFMPYYIGGAFAFEILVFVLLFIAL